MGLELVDTLFRSGSEFEFVLYLVFSNRRGEAFHCRLIEGNTVELPVVDMCSERRIMSELLK